MKERPTEFRGCTWDDGWEYDGPCVLYSPWSLRRWCAAGNSSGIDGMVEDACYDAAFARDLQILREAHSLDKDRDWRGWGRRFDRRRSAWHVLIRVRWDGNEYEIIERTETLGPPEVQS